MKDIYRIAIDGPSGAGKSTIAKAVAKALNIDYIDTGAMYRAVGYKMDKKGIPFEECEALDAMLESTDIDFVGGDVILDGEVVNALIRTPEVSMLASQCSQLAPVRTKLVEIQRGMGQRKSVIMDGRDIGTNVLKDAEYKIFLTASAEERANRRFKELQEKGENQTYEEVLEDIKQRDHNDMTRELNPLRKADDAIEVDTTGMGIDEVVAAVLDIVNK
ncbi:MAG: (d)CMP kinase [Synergistaceae bacterium]|nr:(d)CMP kinase [Synergistaceae bacterium]MBQ3466448.1 (d)CMP kinase [Bacillota bacterium]